MQAIQALRKALATNLNTSSFTALPPVIARPSGDGVWDFLSMTPGGIPVTPKFLFIQPYGLGSNNDAFDLKITGWRHVGTLPPQGIPLWVPQTLALLTCTISSTAKGAAGAPVIDTEFFADTITIKTAGIEPIKTNNDSGGAGYQGFIERYSPADDATPGWVKIPLQGVEMWQIQGDQTTNTPTMNALFCYEDE